MTVPDFNAQSLRIRGKIAGGVYQKVDARFANAKTIADPLRQFRVQAVVTTPPTALQRERAAQFRQWNDFWNRLGAQTKANLREGVWRGALIPNSHEQRTFHSPHSQFLYFVLRGGFTAYFRETQRRFNM